MKNNHQCSAGGMVDIGGLLQTQNKLEYEMPGGGIYCCKWIDYQAEHCFAHRAPVFKRHGEKEMTSPAGNVRHCIYHTGGCVLEDKTTLVWEPNFDQHCEFLR